eukprot:TRINITY_DN41325_c0_g1_i1.p2 TRINITY_DN41325_c0_g1~~TRINITY_DN41325_c0_g1_i1.p2  ORF type:complete len:116 (+),score=7.79 TRINITY_DN41325_c0_g1_i1:239-586(+)
MSDSAGTLVEFEPLLPLPLDATLASILPNLALCARDALSVNAVGRDSKSASFRSNFVFCVSICPTFRPTCDRFLENLGRSRVGNSVASSLHHEIHFCARLLFFDQHCQVHHRFQA